MTPYFAGSEPVIATSGKYKGTVILQDEQDKGFAMFKALTDAQRKRPVSAFPRPETIILRKPSRTTLCLTMPVSGSRIFQRPSASHWWILSASNLAIWMY